jgi:hypothetical protein
MVCTPAGVPMAADGTVDHGAPLATTCSGLRTVSSGLANSDTFRPTIRFLSPFGDITLWNILISCVVLPYISLYSRMTNQMLWGHILSVAPETASMEGEARFHLDTSHNRPDAFVT